MKSLIIVFLTINLIGVGYTVELLNKGDCIVRNKSFFQNINPGTKTRVGFITVVTFITIMYPSIFITSWLLEDVNECEKIDENR